MVITDGRIDLRKAPLEERYNVLEKELGDQKKKAEANQGDENVYRKLMLNMVALLSPRCQVSPRCDRHGRVPGEPLGLFDVPFPWELIRGLASHGHAGTKHYYFLSCGLAFLPSYRIEPTV